MMAVPTLTSCCRLPPVLVRFGIFSYFSVVFKQAASGKIKSRFLLEKVETPGINNLFKTVF